MPMISAAAMPTANERSEISTALMNFSVGRMVSPAVTIRDSGGKMLEIPTRPTTSQTANQNSRETPRGIRFPNRHIARSGQLKYFFSTCQISSTASR